MCGTLQPRTRPLSPGGLHTGCTGVGWATRTCRKGLEVVRHSRGLRIRKGRKWLLFAGAPRARPGRPYGYLQIPQVLISGLAGYARRSRAQCALANDCDVCCCQSTPHCNILLSMQPRVGDVYLRSRQLSTSSASDSTASPRTKMDHHGATACGYLGLEKVEPEDSW